MVAATEVQPVTWKRMKRLALLNPYSAGSHALWEHGLQEHLPMAAKADGEELEVRVWSLPGRHWKWRMHASALTLVDRMMQDIGSNWVPDAFLVTDMMDVGQFRAALPARLRHIPVVVYFHENQLTFPNHPERPPKDWDRHYAFLNLTSALLADAVWFNSEYHRRVFLEAIPAFLKGLPTPRPHDALEKIETASHVVPIGIRDDVFLDGEDRPRIFGEGAPVVVWNHRWEYDKGPEAFLHVLMEAKRRGAQFRLAVMGEQFEAAPEAFARMRESFDQDIVQWGMVESRGDYVRCLQSSDVALVTAHHDFFGISVLECAAAGLRMVAPDELAYPEHFGSARLHPRTGLLDAFLEALSSGSSDTVGLNVFTYRWPSVALRAWNSLNQVWN